MDRIRVAVVSAGDEGVSVYRVLREVETVQIAGVADYNHNSSVVHLARHDHVRVTDKVEDLVSRPDIDVIINTTNDPNIRELILTHKCPKCEVFDATSGSLLMAIIKSKVDEKKVKGELWTILNSVAEGIEVVDSMGVVKYVNPAFTRLSGVSSSERVGRNIFEVAPHGALAQSLIKQKSIIGYRTKVQSVNVIANASPILVDGEIEGAVVIFQPITDILKLMDDLQKSTTIIENLYAKIGQITGTKYTFDDIKGQNKAFLVTVDLAKKAAKNELPILLLGEKGTGKDVFAQAIHRASNRRNKPFIKISLTSVPEELLESELFGHEKGAFAGAVKTVLGKIEMVQGGTIYLEDVNELNPYLQNKLLRLLRDGEFVRMGGTELHHADIRLISSTSKDLKALIRKGRFNEDLYYLLNVVELNLVPLKQRREDIPLLVDHFIMTFNRKLGKQIKGAAPDALQLLHNYEWPGNVAELENIIERAMVAADGKIIGRQNLTPYISDFNQEPEAHITEIMPLDKMELIMIKAALTRFGDSLEGKKKAAQALNISLATLYNKLKKYNMGL